MKPLVAQFTLEPLFISFVSFFAVGARLISLIGKWKLIVPTNFRVALFAVPLNVKRVCFVSKLVKLHFTNIIFIISSSQRTLQRRINVVDQRWNNVDQTLKLKQSPTSDFQRFTRLIQRRCPTLKQRWNKIDTTLSWLFFSVSSTLVKAISKPVGLVISTDL